MAKKEDDEKDEKDEKDPDEEFFKEHPDLTDDDKLTLKGYAVREDYLTWRRAQREKSSKKKGGLFSSRLKD